MRRNFMSPFLLLAFLVSIMTCQVKAQEKEIASVDWRNWRGSHLNGSIEGDGFPTMLDPEKNLLWKIELPGKGNSTPIVVDDLIYLTTPSDGKDALLCLDKDGQQQWLTKFDEYKKGKHRNGSGSNSSPVSDGDAIFGYYRSGALIAVEKDGSVRWTKNLIDLFGKIELYWSHGTSPVLTDNYVVMAMMHSGDSYVAAFDKKTGDLAWKVERDFETPREGDQGYATPLLIEFQKTPALLVYGAEHITIYDVEDGKLLFQCGGFNPEKNPLWPSIAMPVVVDDVAIVAAGRNDRKLPLLYGVKLEGSGDVSTTNIIWKRDDIGTFVPCPAVWEGKVYLVRDLGEVECLNPADGKSIWREKFAKHRTKYYSSPLIAGGLLYCSREDGAVFVVDIRDGKFKLLAEADLEEKIIASFIPLDKHILCEARSICSASASRHLMASYSTNSNALHIDKKSGLGTKCPSRFLILL